MATEKWQPCPRCSSNRVENRGGCFFAVLGIALAGIFFWVTFFIPPLGIIGIIAGLIILIISPFMKGFLQCKDCNHAWKFSEEIERS